MPKPSPEPISIEDHNAVGDAAPDAIQLTTQPLVLPGKASYGQALTVTSSDGHAVVYGLSSLSLDITPTGGAYVFDPLKHPHGWHGHFVPTGKLHELHTGDVFHTKSGKVFQVEKHSPSGVKVKTVDHATGKLKGGYTVLPHHQDVELLEKAKAVGTTHPVGDLTPGTFIVTNKGKKFKIKNHGKWTTVLPVDDKGTVKGKHTVLPKTTVATIHAADESLPMTPEVVSKIAEAVPVSAPVTPVGLTPAGLQQKVLDVAQEFLLGAGVDSDGINKVHDTAIDYFNQNGPPGEDYPAGWSPLQKWAQSYAGAWEALVGDAKFAHDLWAAIRHEVMSLTTGPQAPTVSPEQALEEALATQHQQEAMQAAEWGKKMVGEVLPTKFAKAQPRPYEEGVGQHTRVVIRAMAPPTALAMGGWRVSRVTPDGHEQLIERIPPSSYPSKTTLRAIARAHAAPHEAIVEEQTRFVAPDPASQHFKVGDYVAFPNGVRAQVTKAEGEHIEVNRLISGSSQLSSSPLLKVWLGSQRLMPVSAQQALSAPSVARDLYLEWIRTVPGATVHEQTGTVRKAALNKYSPYLHVGWNPEHVIGASVKDALQQMKVHDYLEIKPREKHQIKLVNRSGLRIQMGVEDGKIAGVEQPKVPELVIDGTAGDFHEQLQHVMQTGGDLKGMDPRVGAAPEATTSFLRGLLYDMALGKRNGVQGSKGKVKSDEAYRQELDYEGQTKSLQDFLPEAQQQAGPLNIMATAAAGLLQKEATDPQLDANAMVGTTVYRLKNPEQLNTQQLAMLHGVLKRRGLAQLALERNKQDLAQAAKDIVSDLQAGKLDVPSADPNSPHGTVADYVKSVATHFTDTATQSQLDRQAGIPEAAKALQRDQAQQLIDERRKAEGTIKEAKDDFGLPTWDQVQFKPQTFDEVQQLAQDGRDIPAFYSGGLFHDSVLQHRPDKTEGKVPQTLDGQMMARMQMAGAVEGPNSDKQIDSLKGSYSIHSGRSLAISEPGSKTIEYVYHAQPPGTSGGAPTSQRGVLRMTGFSPKEAASRLKEMGVLGDLEPTVPFEAAMRSPRRHGSIDAMHPAYIRGEAPLPHAPRLLRHGIQHPELMLDIIRSGGLKSIAERWRLGIKKFGVSPSGDMRSGIDHIVFTNYGEGAVGASKPVQILLRPSAFLRRDIVLTNRDFGGSNTRYQQYRNYLNGLQNAAQQPKTNLYEPVSPQVRQFYLDKEGSGVMGVSSAEFNVGPSVPIEDWETVGVADPSMRDQVDKQLDQMLAAGQIKARPKVVAASEIKQHQRAVNQ